MAPKNPTITMFSTIFLPRSVERFQVQLPISWRHGSPHSIAQRFTSDHLGDGPEKSDHHDVQHHLLAEIGRTLSSSAPDKLAARKPPQHCAALHVRPPG